MSDTHNADTVAVVLDNHLGVTLGGVLWCYCGAGSFEDASGHRRHITQVLLNDGPECGPAYGGVEGDTS